jgi:uncharacterized Zn finger protein (UPF0148 family)
MELQCLRCKFKWKSKTGNIPKICPYCGRENSVTDDSPNEFKDVDELLR